MEIQLSHDIEDRLRQAAAAEGVSVSDWIASMIAETTLRRRQLAEFRSAMAERIASADAGFFADGEGVMARLFDELPAH